MLDYKGIEALYTVLELQGFEVAAKKLHITQSAVSQRIKALEVLYGEPVLVRTLPYQATRLGKQLIGHFKRICLLEEDLGRELKISESSPRFSIALNRDSLETWFLDILEESPIFQDIYLDVIADDQERTLEYLKNGRVSACLSTSEKAISNGEVHFLGEMEYLPACSPAFKKKHFFSENLKKSLKSAPAIKFDEHDKLHERYLEKFFNLDGRELNYQVVPSVRGFKKLALLGYGYALIPKLDIAQELQKKQLVQLCDKTWKVPLYWHCWAIESQIYRQCNSEIIQRAIRKLKG